MELPVAPASYRPGRPALLRALDRAQDVLSRAIARETALDGATAFTSDRYPALAAANRAGDLTGADSPAAASELIDRILGHFSHEGRRCLALAGAALSQSRALQDAAEAAGFTARPGIAMILQRYRPPASPPQPDLQIIPARAAFQQVAQLFHIAGHEEAGGDVRAAKQRSEAINEALDDPRFELLLARRQGQPVAAAGLVGLGQMAIITELFTHPRHRGQGIATTLFDHVAELCNRARFEQVLIELPATALAHPLLRRLGFDRFADLTRWSAPPPPPPP